VIAAAAAMASTSRLASKDSWKAETDATTTGPYPNGSAVRSTTAQVPVQPLVRPRTGGKFSGHDDLSVREMQQIVGDPAVSIPCEHHRARVARNEE
jgi:hypothetical protein